MNKTLICFASDSRAYLGWIKNGRPDTRWMDVPFVLPGETEKGDRYLLYIGGADRSYIGSGTVNSPWRPGRGGWTGVEKIMVTDHFFREPVSGEHVFAATGFRPPRSAKVVPAEQASLVWKIVNGRKLSTVDRAVEGILTESRSKYRNPALRQAALQRAEGRCECCGVNYRRKAQGLGIRCLVVHHKNQLKDTEQPRETTLSELAVVCANCHMMIHANPAKALTIAQLQKRIRQK